MDDIFFIKKIRRVGDESREEHSGCAIKNPPSIRLRCNYLTKRETVGRLRDENVDLRLASDYISMAYALKGLGKDGNVAAKTNFGESLSHVFDDNMGYALNVDDLFVVVFRGSTETKNFVEYGLSCINCGNLQNKIEEAIRQCEERMDKSTIRNAICVGHSLGGVYATHMFASWCRRFASDEGLRLTLVSIAAPFSNLRDTDMEIVRETLKNNPNRKAKIVGCFDSMKNNQRRDFVVLQNEWLKYREEGGVEVVDWCENKISDELYEEKFWNEKNRYRRHNMLRLGNKVVCVTGSCVDSNATAP